MPGVSQSQHFSLQNFIQRALRDGWHRTYAKKGKTGVQSLLAHSLNALSISMAIMRLMGWQQGSEKWNAVIASRLFHDYAKRRWKKGERPPKALTEDEITQIKEILVNMGFSEKVAEKSIDLTLKDEIPGNIEDTLALLKREAPTPDEQDIAALGDRLASIKNLSDLEHQIYPDTKRLLNRFNFTLTHHQVGIVRGITTLLLHKSLIRIHREHEFIPVLYFPSGVLYIGKGTPPRIEKEEILHALEEELQEFIKLQASVSIGQAAMGAVNQTPLKAPEYALMSSEANKKFWDYAFSQNVIKSPNVRPAELKGEIGIGSELSSIIDRWDNLEIGQKEALIRLYKGVHHLFVYFNALLKTAIDWGVENAEELASTVFLAEFKKPIPNGLFTLKFTTKKAEVATVINNLLNSINAETNLEKALSILKSFIIETSKQLTQKCSQQALKRISEPLYMLLNDLVHPNFEKTIDITQKSYKEYISGKRKAGTPVCIIDGNPAEIIGIAKLHGQGVQSFTNLLAGGSQITTTNKSRFCKLCNVEAQLRSLLMSRWSDGEILFIIPQVNSTPIILDEIWQRMSITLESIANVGKLSDWSWWARRIIENKLNVDASVFIASFITERKSSNYEILVDNLTQILKEEYENDLNTLLFYYPEIEASDFRDFVEKALERGEIPIEKIREASFRADATITIITANYAVVLIPFKIRSVHGNAKESETSALLRKMFFGTLMARLFLASALYADTPLSVLSAEIFPQGYFRIPKKLGLRPVLENLGIPDESWVPLEKVDELLEKLAALLIAERVLGPDGGYGKDTLLEIATRHPGMVLSRAAQTGKGWYELIKMLDIYWSA